MSIAPAFTVVVPAYNAVDTLPAAIESVLAQTRDDFELIVVDDGSMDHTLDLARSFESDPRTSVVHHENRGLPSARNTGIAHARAPFISFLDSDDLFMPEYLERMGETFDSDPEAGLAYTDAWVLDEESRRIRRTTAMEPYGPPLPPPAEADDFLRDLVRRNFMYVATTVRRDVLDVAGLFNPGLRAAEDYELWMRILAHGYRVVRAPGPLVIRRDRYDSMSKEGDRMFVALREVYRLVADEHPAPADVKEVARTRLRWAERNLALLRSRSISVRARRRARRVLGAARRRLLRTRRWHREPPSEVTEAFPDLQAL